MYKMRRYGGDFRIPLFVVVITLVILRSVVVRWATSSMREWPSSAPLFPRVISVTYSPSALEVQWTANIQAWDARLCALLAADDQRDVVALLLRLLDSQERFEGGTAAHSDLLRRAEALGLLSSLDVELEGGERRHVLLEPLIGMLRDPRTGCPEGKRDAWGVSGPPLLGSSQVEKKMWHLVQPPTLGLGSVRRNRGGGESARAVLFDIGSTVWTANGMHDAHGARWLSRAYEAIGVFFEDIYSWEAVPTLATDFFRDASVEDIGRLHFMNWPVTSALGDSRNPWQLVKRVSSPRDFVVVKLDIDTPDVENELVRQLLEDSELHKLVDVFYFEHHVKINDFEWIWAQFGYKQTLVDTYAIFTALRRQGVRAHSWP